MQPTPRVKRAWHEEKNPEILSQLLDLANAEILRLKKVVEKIQASEAKSQELVLNIEESLKVLRKKYFGKSSEKSPSTRRRRRNSEDPEVLLHSENLLPPLPRSAVKDLLEEVRLHEMDVRELTEASVELGLNDASSSQWERVENFYDESTEIEIVERSYKKIRHRRQKYKLKKEFNQSPEKEDVIVTAEGALKLLPGASYSIDFGVSVVVDKYLNHIPLERQCRMMDSLGLKKVSTNTLYNIARVIAEYLNPVAEKIKKEVLREAVVHADETPWPINNKKDTDGYMWIISNQKGSHYQFEPTRSGKIIKEILKDYEGVVVSDGYSGYTQFKNESSKIDSALCHAHARRYFWDIQSDYPEVVEYLEIYEALFKVEHEAKSFEELKNLRTQESKPLTEKMLKWLIDKLPSARAESKFKQAIQYSLKNWKELTKFLENELIPLSNNEAERTIRHAVMGRKNFYGSRSIDGADVTATLYTIIESTKKVELDPRDYLLTTTRLAAQGEDLETPFEMAKRLRSQ
jgi:transposase